MVTLFILFLQLNPVRAQVPCDIRLTIVRTRVSRVGDEADQLQFGEDTKRRTSLRVHRRFIEVGALKAMGLGRVSRAMRGLNLEGLFENRLARKVRFTELHFNAPPSQVERHRDWVGIGPSVRKQFAADFAEREALLAEALTDDLDVPTVYLFSLESGMLEWHDLEEVAKLGPTRFATKTWLAQFLRRHRVKGAILLSGQLPEASPPSGDSPYRLSVDEVRRLPPGPRVLLFRPARR